MKISFYSSVFVLYVQLLFGLVQLISSEDEENIRIITMDIELKSCHTRRIHEMTKGISIPLGT